MIFLDYNKIVQENKEHLIESYVKQYGERYRKLLTDRFEQIQFCFFEKPDDLSRYAEIKSQDVGVKLTLLCLKELNIGNFEFKNYIFSSKDKNIDRLIKMIFEWGNPINLFNYKNMPLVDISLEDKIFVEIVTHKKIEEVIAIIQKYLSKFSSMFDELWTYVLSYRKRMISLENEEYERLIDREDSLLKKYKLSYLYVLASLNLDDDYFKEYYYLSDDEIKILRKEINMIYMSIESIKFKEYIINSFAIDSYYYDVDFYREINSKAVLSFCNYSKNKSGIFVPTIYFSPLCERYGYLDIILDHEIRHALECSILYDYKCDYVIKCGLCIVRCKENEFCKRKFNLLNEVMTEKMSIQSTRERQSNGIYILDDKDFIGEGFSAEYDKCIPTFDKLFDEDMQGKLLEARINDNLESLYQFITPVELEEKDNTLARVMQTL